MRRRSSSSRSSGRNGRIAALLLVAAFVLSLPAVTTRIYASDEVQFYAFLRSWWFDRDVSFDNEYRHFYESGAVRTDLFRATFLERETPTGLRLNFGTAGSALLWAPFYAAADAGVRLARGAGQPIEADGYAKPYIAAVCYGSAVYGFLALLLSAAVARRLVAGTMYAADAPVPAAVWAVWLGTPLLFYMYVAPAMSHATSAFAVALFVWIWLRVRDRWTAAGTAALGAAAALMTMVREQDAFFAVGPALDFAWTVVKGREWRLWKPAAAGAASAAIVFVPQAAAYLALNGRLGPSQVTSRKMDWASPHALDVLLSPEHGLVFWTPLVVLAALGLGRLVAARRRPGDTTRPVAWGLAAMAALQVYVTGAVQSWTLAGAFGQRRFVGLTVLLVAGLAALAASARPRRRTWVAVVAALCVWWNVGLIVQFGAGLMDRQRLEPARNAYNTFITVPQRLPGIAWRYLFARESFYRPSPPAGDTRDPR